MSEELDRNWVIDYGPVVPKGWVCPKCEKVFAPTVKECVYCNQVSITYSTGPFNTDRSKVELK
jgi:hypothetical protein